MSFSNSKSPQSVLRESSFINKQSVNQPETPREKELLARYALLANEVDRLQAINYQLMRENEDLHLKSSQTLQNSLPLNTSMSEKESDLKAKLNALLIENDRLNQIIKASQNNNKSTEELENKIRILINENARVAQLLENANVENNALKHQFSQLNAPQLNASGYLNEIARLKSELDKWKSKMVDNDIQAYQTKDLQNRLQALLSENERLREQVEVSTKHIRGLENTRLELDQLNLIVNQKNIEIQKLVRQLEESSTELLELRSKARDFESAKLQLEDFQTKIKLIVADNERLYEESYTLVAKLNEAEGLSAQNEQLEAQIGYFRVEVERLNQLIAQLSKAADENPRLKQRVEDLEGKLKIMVNENQRISAEMVEAQRQAENARVGVGQVESLQQSLKLLSQETEGWKKKFSESLKQNELLKTQLAEQAAKLKKLGECERQVRFQNESLLEKLQIIEDSNAKIAKLEQQVREAKTLEETLVAQIQELQKKLAAVLQENDRLNEILIDQQKEYGEMNAKAILFGELQTKVKFYQDELEKYRKESDVLRSKLLIAEGGENKLQELSQLLAHFKAENQRLERELNETKSKLFAQGALEAEMRAKIDAEKRLEMESIISNLKKKFSEEREALESTMSSLQAKSVGLEQKVYLLLQENEKLVFVNQERLNELEAWKARQNEAERLKNEQIEQIKQQYNSKVKYEIDLQLSSHRERSEAETLKLKSALAELERRYSFLASENESLKENNRTMYNEMEEWKSKYFDLEVARLQEIEELKHQFDGFKKTSLSAKDFQLKFNAERAAYETQILQLHQRVQDYEKQINELLVEIEKHSQLTSDRTRESENWRNKLVAIEDHYKRENAELKSQLEHLKSSNLDVKQLTIKYSSERAADQSQIKQLKQLVENYKEELTRLYDLVGQKKKDYENLQHQFEAYKKSNEVKTEKVKNQDQGDVSEKIEQLNKEIRELEESRELYKRQAERNSLELTKKNKELVEKIQELDLLKAKYEDALNNYQDLSAQLFEKLTKST